MPTELSTQATIAVFVSFAIQWLKKSSWFPFLTVETEKFNRWVSVIVAALSGFGIYATWASGTLSVTGVTAANVLHALTHGVQQFALQHAAYRTLIAPPLPGAVQAQQREQTTTHVS
jgi:hypothetical protein